MSLSQHKGHGYYSLQYIFIFIFCLAYICMLVTYDEA